MVEPVSLATFRNTKTNRPVVKDTVGRPAALVGSLSDISPLIGVLRAPSRGEMTQKLRAHDVVDFVSVDDDQVELPNPDTDELAGVPLSADVWRPDGESGVVWVVRMQLLQPFRFVHCNCRVGCNQPIALLLYHAGHAWGYTAPSRRLAARS